MEKAITTKEVLAKLIFQGFTLTDDSLIDARWESAPAAIKSNYRRTAQVLIDAGYHVYPPAGVTLQ